MGSSTNMLIYQKLVVMVFAESKSEIGVGLWTVFQELLHCGAATTK
jgi:hypothetical protein